jgi:hypothetical protein
MQYTSLEILPSIRIIDVRLGVITLVLRDTSQVPFRVGLLEVISAAGYALLGRRSLGGLLGSNLLGSLLDFTFSLVIAIFVVVRAVCIMLVIIVIKIACTSRRVGRANVITLLQGAFLVGRKINLDIFIRNNLENILVERAQQGLYNGKLFKFDTDTLERISNIVSIKDMNLIIISSTSNNTVVSLFKVVFTKVLTESFECTVNELGNDCRESID